VACTATISSWRPAPTRCRATEAPQISIREIDSAAQRLYIRTTSFSNIQSLDEIDMAQPNDPFCDELLGILEGGGQLVDVRSVGEFATGALQGAMNLPLHTLPLRHGDLDRARPVLLYCVSGARSRQAAYYLSQQGFEEVYDLGGYAGLTGCEPTRQ
jgi:phage shock protein E